MDGKMTDVVMKKTYSFFGEFYRDYIDEFYVRLIALFEEKYSSVLNIKGEIVEAQMHDMMASYFRICVRTLLFEMYCKRDAGELAGETGSERYDSFIRILKTEEYKIYLRKRYPVLHKWLVSQTEYRICLLDECLGNYMKDQKKIAEVFGIRDGIIRNIKITNGDSHNRGKKVIQLETGSGRLLYKPHDLSSERLFNYIVEMINMDDTVEHKLATVKSIAENGYAWQEFVNAEECRTREEVEAYYYRIGVYLGILNALSCEDIHRENIIARGNTPLIIDMETLTNSKVQLPDEDASLLDRVFSENIRSVLGTMLLPTNSYFSVFDYDIGGVSGNERIETKKWEGFGLQNSGTDQMRFVKVREFISSKSNNILQYKGEDTQARNHNVAIIRGFQDTYTAIDRMKLQIIQSISESDARIRQVVRPTAVYAKFLEAATYPEYLTDENKFVSLFEKLHRSEDVVQKKKTEHEIMSLLEGDIPYFYNLTNKRNLYSMHGEIENFYQCTISDIVKKNIEGMSDADKNKQAYYINLALSTQKNAEENGAIYCLEGMKESDTVKDVIGVIADTIEEKLVWDKEKKKCFLLTNLTADGKRKYSVMDSSLYYCGGIIMFFLMLYKVTGEEHYKKVTKGLLGAGMELKLPDNLNNIGLFSGLGSVIYLYYQSYRILGDGTYLQLMRQYLHKVDLLCAETKEVDLTIGISGTLILLLEIYEKEHLEECLQIAYIMAERLLELLEEKDYLLNTGLAHGYSGVAWALYKAGYCMGESKYTEIAFKCIKMENQYYNVAMGNWIDLRAKDENEMYWCYGACGIGIARMKMYEMNPCEFLEEEIVKCKNIFLNCSLSDLPKNHSLCHGLSGVVFVMDMYRNHYEEDSALQHKFALLYDNLLEDIRRRGIQWGDKEILEDYTFMLGLSGIGYELLRLGNGDVPSILSLELV